MTTVWLGEVVEPEIDPAPQPVNRSPLQTKIAAEKQYKRTKDIDLTGNGARFLIFCPRLWQKKENP